MKLNTYDYTPRPQKNNVISVLVIIAATLLYGIVGFLVYIYFCNCQWFHGIVVILVAFFATIMVFTAKKDIEKSYIEIVGNDIYIVDYPIGIKIEKRITFFDITSAEICHAYSPKIKGCRFSIASDHFIVFFKGERYLFKIICLPETKEIFKQYIQ